MEIKLKDKSWVFRLSKNRWVFSWRGINTSQRALMTSLWLYAGQKGVCWPSERHLAKELNLGLKCVWHNIKNLEKKGYIRIEKKIGRYNTYILLK